MFDPTTYKDKPETTNVTAKVLRDAAAYMREHGACFGTGIDKKGRVCPLTAISIAEGAFDPEYPNSYWRVGCGPSARAVEQYLGVPALYRWHDEWMFTMFIGGRWFAKNRAAAALEGAAASVETGHG